MPRGGAGRGQGRKPASIEAIAALAEALRPVRVGRNNYTRLDRYRDFNRVFGTPEGKRVLAQIVDHCEGGAVSESDYGNHALLVGRVASRRVGQMILAWASVPPPEDNQPKSKETTR